MKKLLLTVIFLGFMVLLPVMVYEIPIIPLQHSQDWYIANTPKCWSVFCIDIYSDHILLELRLGAAQQ